ncbi:MAG: hypothetical protein N3B13_01570 [Deltaproteobacteria bacterium]|nr:hypothetical protein [Deltaproteobacteria bacterium]
MRKFYIVSIFLSFLIFIGAQGENSLGVNTHILHNDVYDAVAAAGIPWIRIDVNWFDVEPQQNKFNWNEIDRVVNKALSLNLKIFATFAYTPQWASSGNKDGKSYGNDVPKPGLYEKALSEAVKRYRGKIYHWGLWNEVNLGGFWEGSADQYVDLIVIPGYNAIKSNCPECYSLGPELANVGDELNNFYNTIFSRAKDKFDIITHHIYQTFPELDPWVGYTSDSFFNALEKKRTFSNRMALYEALTKYNITHKEVWITETGYRCKPPTDSSEMSNQKLYYELVLKAQIERAWWTNTFFYEIYDCGTDIPDCDIDGYGILRRTSPADNSYQDNFLFKPAYYFLKDFLDRHPEFKGQPLPDAGYDIVQQDTGSKDAESSDTGVVERKKVVSVRTYKPPVIDGDLSDFIQSRPITLNSKDYVKLTSDTSGDNDISGIFYFMWDESNLYIAVVVKDDINYNIETPENIWKGDSVQIAFDADFDKTEMTYDSDGDYEIGFAVVNNSVSSYRWVSPITAPSLKMVSAYKKSGDTLSYEVSIPFSNLFPLKPVIGKLLGVSFLINDNDGSGREGFVQFTDGIGLGKNPSAFGEMVLSGGACESDKECINKSDCTSAVSLCNCPGNWICNGRNFCEWICVQGDGGSDTGIISDSENDFVVYTDAYTDAYQDNGMTDGMFSDKGISDNDTENYSDCKEGICIENGQQTCSNPEYPVKTDIVCKTGGGASGFCCIKESLIQDVLIRGDAGIDVSVSEESTSGCGCTLIN